MTDSILATRYDLARHVPDMTRGFTIHTNYGDLAISPDEAQAFAQLTEQVLKTRLTLLESAQSPLDETATNAGA